MNRLLLTTHFRHDKRPSHPLGSTLIVCNVSLSQHQNDGPATSIRQTQTQGILRYCYFKNLLPLSVRLRILGPIAEYSMALTGSYLGTLARAGEVY
jgi:hypothetical protein